jgi:hypothetical protein
MASGIFKLRDQLQGLVQKSWTSPPTYSGFFNGTNQYLTTSSTSAFNFGSGNFTVEFWLNTTQGTGNIINPNTGSSWALFLLSGSFYWNNAYNVTNLFTVNASSVLNGAWHQIVFVRSSGTIYVYFDGVLQTSNLDPTVYTAAASTWNIGNGNVGYYSNLLSNLRITTTAVYTSAFTPPTSPLTAITGTQLLTLQNPTIVDNSANALTITNNNGVTTPAQYFFPPATKRITNFVEYLVVAGGGGGGRFNGGGGGGAGGLLQGITSITTGSAITVTVGAGGAGSATTFGTSGLNSVFGAISAVGGGGGGGADTSTIAENVGRSGGSGGGSGTNTAITVVGGAGTSGQGYAGGSGKSDASTWRDGGGGGGAGTVGFDVVGGATLGYGNGGAGIASAINGTVTAYAGGGGGGTYGSGVKGSGGVGGGGNGGESNTSTAATAGTANTGGGGGGGGSSTGATGGSGIVIIRYPNSFSDATSVTNGTKTSITGFTVYTFLISGSITF